jgi:hypothetical protein
MSGDPVEALLARNAAPALRGRHNRRDGESVVRSTRTRWLRAARAEAPSPSATQNFVNEAQAVQHLRPSKPCTVQFHSLRPLIRA